MRERAFLWDLATLFLLGVLVLTSLIQVMQSHNIERLLNDNNKRSSELQSQNREILNKLEQGIRVSGNNGGGNTNTSTQTVNNDAIKPVSGTLFDGSDLPKVVQGDENATDGDWLMLNAGAEPKALNAIVENDASVTEYFGLVSDPLITRSFDDLTKFEGKLARAWEKAMILRGIAAKKDAAELVKKLEAGLTPEQRKDLQVGTIKADGDVLEVHLRSVNTGYREIFEKILGADAIAPQHWFYFSLENGDFLDGKPITAKAVGELLSDALKKSGAPASILSVWEREGSVVLMLSGDGTAAEKALKDFVAGPGNKGRVTDPKSPTGKREDKIIIYDLKEDYVFQEKPVFTFHLRKDIKWHDGVPFTGKDVIFSFNTIMNPKIEAAPTRNYLQDCESCKLVNEDPYIVQFVWRKPYFLAFSFSGSLDIMPEHYFKFTNPDEFNSGPKNATMVGNGPYKLERWDRKERISFVRNEDYYGHKPHLKKMVYGFVQDRTVGFKMLQAGDIDIEALTKAQMKDNKDNPEFNKKFNINVSVANVYRYIGWNCRIPKFSTEKTRRALSMMVDRKRIVEDIYRGYALPLYGPAHPDSANYSPEIEKISPAFDIEAAKKLLAEDGWKDTDGDNVIERNGEPFRFAILYPSGSPEVESIANLVKNTFAQAGIIVTPSPIEWSVFIEKVERIKFDAMMLGWRLGVEDDPYQLWHSSQTIEKASNHCGFVNKEADRLIENGRRELDDAKRIAMFRKVNELIVQGQPYTFLLVDKRTIASDKRIQNVQYKLVGAMRDRWWVPTELQKHK